MAESNSSVAMPRHRREVNGLISHVGRLEKRRASLKHKAEQRKTRHKQAIDRIELEVEAELATLMDKQTRLMARINRWCSAKWQELTRGQTRKINFATGSYRRAHNLSAVGLTAGTTEAQVVQFLVKSGSDHLRQYLRPDIAGIKKDEVVRGQLIEAGLMFMSEGDTVYVQANICEKATSRPASQLDELVAAEAS